MGKAAQLQWQIYSRESIVDMVDIEYKWGKITVKELRKPRKNKELMAKRKRERVKPLIQEALRGIAKADTHVYKRVLRL